MIALQTFGVETIIALLIVLSPFIALGAVILGIYGLYRYVSSD